jgi:hypothetical protein
LTVRDLLDEYDNLSGAIHVFNAIYHPQNRNTSYVDLEHIYLETRQHCCDV